MDIKNLNTFDYEIYGGIFTAFRSKSHYLVKKEEPIPLSLLRKTHVNIGPARPRVHPISGAPINYGQVPFGFKNVNGTLQKDPMEQFVLQQMKNMRENGSSLCEIARYLVQSGIPTKNGGKWQSNTVNKILNRQW